MESDFLYKVVFFKQPGCVACAAMESIWSKVAGELAESHPHYNIGFGTWNVNDDNWEFCDFVGCDGTPNFVVINKDNSILGLNTDGLLAATQLKDFILGSIEGTR